MAVTPAVQEIFNSIYYIHIVSWSNAASITLLAFDSLLTFEREVRIVWFTKWNYTKLMYILTRYSTFIQAIIVAYQIIIPGDWFDDCALVFKLNIWIYVFGLGTGELIMTIRTWAVWGKPKIMAYLLTILYISVWAGGFVVTGIFTKTVEFKPSPITEFVGCYATRTDPIIFISWLLLLFYDTVMFVLIAIPGWKAYKQGGRSRLIKVVYQDGILYYLYLFAISAINIVVTLLSPKDLTLLFSLVSRVLHTIFSCRVVLHIADHAQAMVTASAHQLSNGSSTGPTSPTSWNSGPPKGRAPATGGVILLGPKPSYPSAAVV